MPWTTIKVSSPEVTWPGRCACCNEPSETSVGISGQQVTGARYVQLKVQSWVVPYCETCRKHVHLGQEAEHASVTARQLPGDAQRLRAEAEKIDTSGATMRMVGRVTQVLVFLSGWFIFSWIATLFLEAGSLAPLGLAIGIGFVLAIGETAVFQLLFRIRVRETIRRAEEEKAKQLTEADQAEAAAETLQKKSEALTEKCKSLLKPSCTLHSIAVIYDGWYGNTHTFRFHNPTFLDAFREANAAIVLPPDQTPKNV
jgi:hypothetical protein